MISSVIDSGVRTRLNSDVEDPCENTDGAAPESISHFASSHNSIGHFRWTVCALLFLATTVNYIDRQVIAVLKPVLEDNLHWNEIDYSNIVVAFQAAYAIGLVAVGALIDRIGVRVGMLLAVLGWSLAAIGHGLVSSVMGFCTARFALGITESANFPASIKAVGEWFPKKERALATGVFNAGSNVGALLTPLTVPWIVSHWGWRAAFYVTGSLGCLWVLAWGWLYRSPEQQTRLSLGERAYILSDSPARSERVPWRLLLRLRQTWAFAIAKLLTDPIWWLYLFWAPDFLHKRGGLDLIHLGPPLVVIYLMTDVGSIGGGWISSRLLKRGWSANAARKTAMLLCALCVVPVAGAAHVSHIWAAVLLIGLAASAHQGFSANLFTVVSDTCPPQTVSSVVGFGGMAGAIGGMLIAKIVGYLLQRTGSYTIILFIPTLAYPLALLNLHLWLPRLQVMAPPDHG